jgi:hypothetical protein
MIELNENQIAERFGRIFDIFQPGSVLRSSPTASVREYGEIIQDFSLAELQYQKSLFKVVDKEIARMKQWNAKVYTASTLVRCHTFRNRLSQVMEEESPATPYKESVPLTTALFHTGMALSQLVLCDDEENNKFIETILNVYQAGGWPCGLKGHGDRKRLLIYISSHVP